ncbi:Glucose-methanol-choline (GMC) oxidoreductase:NAD binding site [hydrothermal vent metagenome]|uniref:Glucose-methanol-choline (GMC) oxidoreductase:NAD binding site n=1 Tax=hydrothermal vent metagenome TaxID=652676 RepID=A0A3B0ZWQ0_9ZZZZ
MSNYDVCIIGSGAGGGPIAYQLSKAGYNVIVLEKGPFLKQDEFCKDELACCRRSVYTPALKDEFHVIEDYDGKDEQGNYKWVSKSTIDSGWDFWNGNMVGGASNLMSGFFHRLKPEDFRLKSEFGEIKDANVVDWPIEYNDLEPYYALVEQIVGVSGKIKPHPNLEPRSTNDFPYPPTIEHPITKFIDQGCEELQLHSLATPRAILPTGISEHRGGCQYSGYCGSYGCTSGAKGSSREALLNQAVATGHCTIQDHAKVTQLISNQSGKVTQAKYIDKSNKHKFVQAKIFVVACQAVETSRLLLSSTGPKHQQGLGNQYHQVGKNMLFSAGGSGSGEFHYSDYNSELAKQLKVRGPFVNRYLQDWYFINDKKLGRSKGGTVEFLLSHPNPVNRANGVKWGDDDKLVWGSALKQKLKTTFTQTQKLKLEIFCDWLPTDDCYVSLDTQHKDKWGSPVAKLRVGYHDHDLVIGNYILEQSKKVFAAMKARNIHGSVSGSPPPNLQAGGCRFGDNPETSVLDKDCRIHNAENVFVTDGSWMPTGGSVPYTFTIYANAFRVADIVKKQL